MIGRPKGQAKRAITNEKAPISTQPQVHGGREDLSPQFQCPFPIYSDEEGIRYQLIKHKFIVLPKYFDVDLLIKLGLKSKIDELVGKLGLQVFVGVRYQVYKELTLEFFTTLKYASKNGKSIAFRIKGVEYSIGYDFMIQEFKLPKGDLKGCPSNFDCNRVWKRLTNNNCFDTQRAPNGLIIEPSLIFFHTYFSHSICGKKESNTVTKEDLLVLNHLVRRNAKSVDFVYLIFKSMMAMANHAKMVLGNGHLITSIAMALHAIEDEDLDKMDCLRDDYLNEFVLRKADILDEDGAIIDVKDQNCYLSRIGEPKKGKSKVEERENESEQDEENESSERDNAQDDVVREDNVLEQPIEKKVRRPTKLRQRETFEEEVLRYLNESNTRLNAMEATNLNMSKCISELSNDMKELQREQRRANRRWKACFGTLVAHDPSPLNSPEN